MKTVYANSANPKKAAVATYVCFALAIGFYLLWAGLYDSKWMHMLGLLSYIVFFGFAYLFMWKAQKCEVDDEAGTLVTPECKKHPMSIADIDNVNYCQTKRGKLRYICIHERGVRFANAQLKRAEADRLVAHLQSINPSIIVKKTNYY